MSCNYVMLVCPVHNGTVVPLLKDTLAKGHLSNEDRIIWQQVLWIAYILPLTKGHLSNEDRIIFGGRGVNPY